MTNETNGPSVRRNGRLAELHTPDELRDLPQEEIDGLCREIRACLCERVSENGGHLASNLGVVEMTVALERNFDFKRDHLIFDVGHQCYVHKLLTGRFEAFDTLRTPGGISGFPRRDESPYDAFGTGHGSTSLSAALGFSRAEKLRGSDAWTVAVVGDGAYTGGMIHEALNNCDKDLRLLIILNENEMSISPNIGRFAAFLSHLRATRGYYRTKSFTRSLLMHIPLIGKPLFRLIRRIKKHFKNRLYGSNYFEDMGLYYLGPADGNDFEAVETLLREAKSQGGSAVIHLKTKKGKGFEPAEVSPELYHGMAPGGKHADTSDFSAVFGETLSEMAKEDPSVCAITAAMTDGTGLESFREEHPERFFDVGMAEEHAVTFAAGLAAAGCRPFVAIYSTFLQRSYDQILHDVAMQNLPVVFCVDRAGLNSHDGVTHHGVFDVSFLSSIPGIEILTPATNDALRVALRYARTARGPVAIRYPHACENPLVRERFYSAVKDADLQKIAVRTDFKPSDAPQILLLTHGRMINEVMRAADILASRGVRAGILLTEYLKPYDRLAKEVASLLSPGKAPLLCVEEEIRAGGMGMLLRDKLEPLTDHPIDILAPDDRFIIPGKGETVFDCAGVSAEAIVKNAVQLIS